MVFIRWVWRWFAVKSVSTITARSPAHATLLPKRHSAAMPVPAYVHNVAQLDRPLGDLSTRVRPACKARALFVPEAPGVLPEDFVLHKRSGAALREQMSGSVLPRLLQALDLRALRSVDERPRRKEPRRSAGVESVSAEAPKSTLCLFCLETKARASLVPGRHSWDPQDSTCKQRFNVFCCSSGRFVCRPGNHLPRCRWRTRWYL